MSKTTAAKNTEPQVDYSTFEEEAIGFPPYWNPSDGALFHARVVASDERDPAFPRYVLMNVGPTLQCFTGPSDEAEEVAVKAGEMFTISHYAALPLERYFGFDVLVRVKDKRDLKGGKTLWVFSLAMSPETKKALQAARMKAVEPQLQG